MLHACWKTNNENEIWANNNKDSLVNRGISEKSM